MKKLLLLLCLISCGGYADPNMVLPGGEEIREAVSLCSRYEVARHPTAYQAQQEALDMWNNAVGFEWLVLVGSEKALETNPPKDAVGHIELRLEETIKDGEKEVDAYGEWGPGCSGLIKMTVKGQDNPALWGHELGHVFGFQHVNNSESIMFEDPSEGEVQLTETMVEEVLRNLP